MNVYLKSNILRKAMLVNNINQYQFAKIIGICRGHASMILKRKRNPSPKVRKQLLIFLNLHSDKIYKFSDLFSIRNDTTLTKTRNKLNLGRIK